MATPYPTQLQPNRPQQNKAQPMLATQSNKAQPMLATQSNKAQPRLTPQPNKPQPTPVPQQNKAQPTPEPQPNQHQTTPVPQQNNPQTTLATQPNKSQSTSAPKTYTFNPDCIKCPLCSKYYMNPRQLPCLHSFCSDCIDTLIQDGNKSTTTTTAKPGANKPKAQVPTPSRSKPSVDGQAITGPNSGKTDPKPGGPNTSSRFDGKGGKILLGKPTGAITKKPDTKDATGTSPAPSKPNETHGPNQELKKAEVKDATPGKYKTGDKGFPCPRCKKFTSTPELPKTHPDNWAALFPENNLLADLVDLYSLKRGTRMCDPCKRNKTSAPVHSYCKNCRDAMCESCAMTHKGLRSCKKHKVLSTVDFEDALNLLKVEEELCEVHDGKPVEHYCYTHSVMCCSQCMSGSHRKCERVSKIEDVVQKSRANGEIQTLDGALDKYRGHVDLVLKERASTLKKLDTKKGKLMTDFTNVKKHIMAQLEKMEKDLKTVLDGTHRTESKKIKQEADRCREIQSALVNSSGLLKVADHHGANSQVLGTIEKVRGECEYYEECLKIVCSRIREVDYDISLDETLQEVMNRLNQFGRINVNTTPSKLPAPPRIYTVPPPPGPGNNTNNTTNPGNKVKNVKPSVSFQGSHARQIGEFSGGFEEDEQECWFTGAAFIPDGRIILVDRTNRKLKLFTSNFAQITELGMSSKPWDVAVTSEYEVAVSLPAECRIEFINVAGLNMSTVRSIFTDEPCFGICYTNGKILAVTYDGDPPNLKILSTTGQELTYVCFDDSGLPLFSKPVYVACSPNASTIYVSDERLGCVVILKETGNLQFNYSSMYLGHAAGVTLDKDSNIYVCGSTSSTVHVVSPRLDKMKVLVNSEHITYPRAIAVNAREKKLLVTQGDQDIVKVYNLA